MPRLTFDQQILIMFLMGTTNQLTHASTYSYKPPSNLYIKSVYSKQNNSIMRATHNIYQPRWKGCSH